MCVLDSDQAKFSSSSCVYTLVLLPNLVLQINVPTCEASEVGTQSQLEKETAREDRSWREPFLARCLRQSLATMCVPHRVAKCLCRSVRTSYGHVVVLRTRPAGHDLLKSLNYRKTYFAHHAVLCVCTLAFYEMALKLSSVCSFFFLFFHLLPNSWLCVRVNTHTRTEWENKASHSTMYSWSYGCQ